jgi:uncharacterized protein YegP (UPF0339 family)
MYSSMADCTKGIEKVREICDDDNSYERKKSSNNKPFFNLKASNGHTMKNISAKILLAPSSTHSPDPLLLQAKEGGVKHFATLCFAKRAPITIGRDEFM